MNNMNFRRQTNCQSCGNCRQQNNVSDLTAAATNLSLNQEMTTRDVAARWVRSAATAATGRM